MAWLGGHRHGGGPGVSIDPAAVLALISELTQRVAQLQGENEQLRATLDDRT